MFTTNAKGWTNNFHGMQWIRHFNAQTRLHIQDPDEYRLLLWDSISVGVQTQFSEGSAVKLIKLTLAMES
jgi:hypothetical protein